MTDRTDHRLPPGVRPVHYDVTLDPDLHAATFDGRVEIEVDVMAPTDTIVCNSADLEILHVEVIDPTGAYLSARPELDEEAERLALRCDETLQPGRYRLVLDFTGVLNDQLRGFYRSTYTDDAGVEHVIATTQFEATDARRAFPCWDEPAFKATFDVTLMVPEGMMAVSCSPITASDTLGGGRRRVRFGTTMPLSTYLLAFVVGDLVATEPVDVAGTPLRIVHVPGKEDLTDFALEFGAFALGWFTEYYGIPYPGDKLDLIAIPDFASGAMENLGAITFRESVLLVDPSQATQAELSRVAEVIAHEIAHMWFGDLVTMKWWNGLWLKEAFATFMEMLCVDAFRPEWKSWLAFAAERERALEIDGLESTRPIEFDVRTPDEADEMFDDITYGKGAAVLRMLEQFLGAETFRQAISNYLSEHAYGNTDTEDLWAALDAVSEHPVDDMMNGWIFVPGHPVVLVGRDAAGLHLAQRRSAAGGRDARWHVPLLLDAVAGTKPVVLTDPRVVPGATTPNVDRGGNGFFRVAYGDELWPGVVASAPERDPVERHRLVGDTWAAVLVGHVPAAGYLELLVSLGDEPEARVWDVMLAGLDELDRLVAPAQAVKLQRFVRDLLTPAVRDAGWEPEAGESDLVRRRRGALIRALGVIGRDAETRRRATETLAAAVHHDAGLDREVAAAVVSIAAAFGGEPEHGVLGRAYTNAHSPQDEVRLLAGLAAIPDARCAAATLDLVTTGQVRSQHAASTVARLVGNRDSGAIAWRLVTERWDEILSVVPRPSQRNLLAFIHLRSEPDLSPDVEAWLAAHPLPAAERGTRQQLERLNLRRALRRRAADLDVPPVALR